MVVTFKSSVCYLYDCNNKLQCYNELNHFLSVVFKKWRIGQQFPLPCELTYGWLNMTYEGMNIEQDIDVLIRSFYWVRTKLIRTWEWNFAKNQGHFKDKAQPHIAKCVILYMFRRLSLISLCTPHLFFIASPYCLLVLHVYSCE